jgi:glycosyltransferase involved in cell wall biosynthesis
VIHYGKQPPKDHAEAYRRFFSSAENVIAVSADIKRNFDDKYGICCQIIPPLVPFEKSKIDKILLRKTYNIPFDATAICMVGSIKGMKNPDTILEAVNMIGKEEIEKYNLHIIYAGSGEMTEMLKHKADGYGLGERVHFLGFVPKEKVNEVMSLSDLYVIASDFEGTSVSLLEAMYNGIPVIASNAPGIKDTITPKECTMFPTRDAAVLKNAVLTMITDKPLCERLAENARQRYLNLYDYDNVISSYLSILNR